VDDSNFHLWAAYFLRGHPCYFSQYRGYMEAIGHIPQTADAAGTPWLLTDAAFDGRTFRGPGWRLAWSRGPYHLWRAEGPAWAVPSACDSPGRPGPLLSPAADGALTFDALANRDGTLELKARLAGWGRPVEGDPVTVHIRLDNGYEYTRTSSGGVLHLDV